MPKTYTRRQLVWTSIASAIAGFLILNGSVSHFYKVHFSNDPEIMPCSVRIYPQKREKFLTKRYEETGRIGSIISILVKNGFEFHSLSFQKGDANARHRIAVDTHSIAFRSQSYGYCGPWQWVNPWPPIVAIRFDSQGKLIYIST